MRRVVTRRTCWRLVKYVTSLTLILVIVRIYRTATLTLFEPKLIEISVTAAVTDNTDLVDSNVTAFRGSLISSSDQLADFATDISRCVTANVGGMTFPICLYRETEDVRMSKSFIRGNYWERERVERFIRLLRRYPDVDFVDLTANIGTFTLPAAHFTHVVAVEPYVRSMARLFKSIQLGGVENNVSLVLNAISNERSTSTLGFHPNNVGGTFLKAANTSDCVGGSCTQTILLHDLLPLMRRPRAVIKADVEAHQTQVFTNSTAAKFFDQIDVPLIYMEWNLCRGQNTSLEVQHLIRFFSERQYVLFSENNRRLRSDCRQWSENVFFTKKSLEF